MVLEASRERRGQYKKSIKFADFPEAATSKSQLKFRMKEIKASKRQIKERRGKKLGKDRKRKAAECGWCVCVCVCVWRCTWLTRTGPWVEVVVIFRVVASWACVIQVQVIRLRCSPVHLCYLQNNRDCCHVGHDVSLSRAQSCKSFVFSRWLQTSSETDDICHRKQENLPVKPPSGD